MTKLNQLKKHLRSGQVYRRSDLEAWSTSVDRHLAELMREGRLEKLSGGLYYCPKMTQFGVEPPEDQTLVEAFLNDDRFLLTSPNAYNSLGVGATQLYNQTVVYNHKRHGRYQFGHREFDFRKKPHFPRKLSTEFLLVDLVNNVKHLAEDKEALLENALDRAASVDQRRLSKAVKQYGGVAAKKLFAPILARDTVVHDA